ncbi:hypothetical protein LPJ56_000497 [Coemansia sp. RSA 2599]|nr:hypothetical protein LPJ75_000189 [Coemansia sp. RSA 2598]KAJ1829256.1 hypothetical protein LPJ56_000497 [Coemansia sp. RSA 2599]
MSQRDNSLSSTLGDGFEMPWPAFAKPRIGNGDTEAEDSDSDCSAAMELDTARSGTRGEQSSRTQPWRGKASDRDIDSSSDLSSEEEGLSDDQDDSGIDDNSPTVEGPPNHRPHRWRSRPPLLPQRMASFVSTVSGATRLSLEITSLFWEAIFDTIAESTSSGLWLGSAAWDEARTIALAVAGVFSPLSSLNPRIISRIVSSSTAAGYSVVNQSLTAAESLLEGGFTLYTKAVNMSLHAAGEYVRFIDAVFGSTDTSRVLASFVHMCRREAVEKNPEIQALIKEHGLVGFVSQLLKTIAAWICLQVVTHGRQRAYRMDLVHTNIGAKAVFCPRRFIDSDGKPLQPAGASTSAALAAAGRASSTRLWESRSPRIRVSGIDSVQSPPSQNGLLAVMPNEGATPLDSAAGNEMHSHMHAQTNRKFSSREHIGFTMASATSASTPAAAAASAPVPSVQRSSFLLMSNDDEYSGSSDDDDSVYYALSDQEASHRDPEWDQRLIEALRNLSIQKTRQRQQKMKQQQEDNEPDTDMDMSMDVDVDPDLAGAAAKHPETISRSASKSSLWNTLTKMREAAAAAAAITGTGANADESTNSASSGSSSGSESPSSSSPAIPSVLHNGCLLPALESAPASLVSSPQFPVTPDAGLFRGSVLHRARTASGALDPDWQQSNGAAPGFSKRPGMISLTRLQVLPDAENIELLDGIPPSVVHEASDPMSASTGSNWMQQEFPRKPLLVNLARFISIASSAYGHSFMKVLGLSHGMIDARALIEDFGDFEVHEQDSSSRRVSLSGSAVSMDQVDCAANAASTAATSGKSQQHSRSPSFSRLPRAQPMSAYHTHSAYNPSRPTSQRQYERRHFRSSRPETPGGPRMPGRRPPVRRLHHRRRPVTDHPNHFSFSQHTGIPLSDLLFSSYVSPIVPGVTRAASAQASAVERELRRKKSGAGLDNIKGKKKKKSRKARSSKDKATAAIDLGDVASSPSTTPPPPPQMPASSAPPASQQQKGWLSAIPVVGTIYNALPSPASAFAAIPILPGVVSRVLGGSADAKDASEPGCIKGQASAESSGAKQAEQQREPTPGQFRRFDRIRQRLVYRNPSIHALVHYIAVDHATRSVVLACRGTLGISDLFVDMICEYETVQLPGHPATRDGQEFRVHSGMWHSALMLSDTSSEVFKEVAEALRLYPEYGLVLTGHSLGGGVASLLTLLWSQPLFDHKDPAASTANLPPTPGSTVGSLRRFVTTDKFGLVSSRPIHCFSFGSPCSTNAALSYYCRGLVTSVANTDDFVTYLSVGACVDILNISAVLGRERGVAEKIVRRFMAAQRDKIGRKLNLFDFDFSKLRAYSYSDDEEDKGDDDDEKGQDKGKSKGYYWWSRATASSAGSDGKADDDGAASSRSGSPLPSRPSKRQKNSQDDGDGKGNTKGKGKDKSKSKSKSQLKADLDDWHWSLVKTLRANMDSEKLYPPGDVFILAMPGDDEVADRRLPKQDAETKQSQTGGVGTANPAQKTSSRSTPSAGEGPSDKAQPVAAAVPVGLFYCPDVTERFSELRFTRNMIAHHLPSTYERRISALIHECL